MNKRLNQLIRLLKENFVLFLGISFSVFLYMLFFQPFPPENFDFNNNLLYASGLGAIIFIDIFLIRILFLSIIKSKNKTVHDSVLLSYLSSFIIWAIATLAFAFYLHYIGLVEITFFVVTKIAFICLAPVVLLKIYDVIHELKQQNESLIIEKKIIQKQVEKYEEGVLNRTIEFYSENSTENLSLLVSDVAFIKSADNYVEIVFKQGEDFKKKLIRNTLKNVEQQTKQYPNFIRCHRTCIINTLYVEKLNRDDNNHWLTINGYDEQIPVSRQYLLKIKETI